MVQLVTNHFGAQSNSTNKSYSDISCCPTGQICLKIQFSHTYLKLFGPRDSGMVCQVVPNPQGKRRSVIGIRGVVLNYSFFQAIILPLCTQFNTTTTNLLTTSQDRDKSGWVTWNQIIDKLTIFTSWFVPNFSIFMDLKIYSISYFYLINLLGLDVATSKISRLRDKSSVWEGEHSGPVKWDQFFSCFVDFCWISACSCLCFPNERKPQCPTLKICLWLYGVIQWPHWCDIKTGYTLYREEKYNSTGLV